MLPHSLKTHFAAAIRRLLRPVIRQVIAHGISYPTFNQMVKQLFVEVAESDFALPFKRQTDSRLALVTGLSRKEVSQLRRKRPSVSDAVLEVEESIVTHVIGRWMAGPPYATPDGVARRLRYESDDAQQASFSGLVRELGVDIPVRAVLDELLRLGSVVLRPEGDVELRHEAHIPAEGTEGKLALLSDPAEMFSTIVHNIEQPEAPWLQRKVVYDNIGSSALQTLEEEVRRVGGEFVRRANALLASYDRDRHPEAPGGKRSRVAVGVYYFEEPVKSQVPSEKAEPPSAPPGRIQRKK